jgi:acyl carrier protein
MPADLHATSLDSMEMVVGVEEGFRIEIHDREAAKLVFVADFEL